MVTPSVKCHILRSNFISMNYLQPGERYFTSVTDYQTISLECRLPYQHLLVLDHKLLTVEGSVYKGVQMRKTSGSCCMWHRIPEENMRLFNFRSESCVFPAFRQFSCTVKCRWNDGFLEYFHFTCDFTICRTGGTINGCTYRLLLRNLHLQHTRCINVCINTINKFLSIGGTQTHIFLQN